MKNNFIVTFIVCFVITGVYAQTNLNGYKYVIVPNKFSFLKKTDQYKLNGLTHFLFNKHGFKAFLEGSAYPDDFIISNCNVLHTDVVKESNLFTTKLKIILKDCYGKTIYTSPIGLSREKDYAKAYTEALRNSFKSIASLGYKYNAKQDKKAGVNARILNNTPLKLKKENIFEAPVSKNQLYAIKTQQGYYLKASSNNKVVYVLLNTSLPHVYLVENKKAIIYKDHENWFIDYYDNSIKKHYKLSVKF